MLSKAKKLFELPKEFSKNKNMIKLAWQALEGVPLGKQVFSLAVGRAAPYTGNMRAKVVELRPGYAKVVLRDRPSLRNHLKSIHAIALANLAELAGNIALSYSLPDDARFIVANIDIKYLKKARGTIYASSHCPIPETSERQEYLVPVDIHNADGELLCQATLTSLVGPK